MSEIVGVKPFCPVIGTEGVAKLRGTGFGLSSAERHFARDSLRHVVENRAFFTGKMPVPRLKISISQLPFHVGMCNRACAGKNLRL